MQFCISKSWAFVATSKAQQVYVALLDEAVECWRSVEAQHVEADEYVLSGAVVAFARVQPDA